MREYIISGRLWISGAKQRAFLVFSFRILGFVHDCDVLKTLKVNQEIFETTVLHVRIYVYLTAQSEWSGHTRLIKNWSFPLPPPPPTVFQQLVTRGAATGCRRTAKREPPQ